MAKRVAECIIDLLHHDQTDLKQYFKRCKTDWKWMVRQDIKQQMRKNNIKWGISYKMLLDIHKYYHCNCEMSCDGSYRKCSNLNVPRITHSPTETDDHRRLIYREIDNLKDDPAIMWLSKYSPLARITCHKLQQLIDYCKSLGFKITVFYQGGKGTQIYINWNHWVNKDGNIIV